MNEEIPIQTICCVCETYKTPQGVWDPTYMPIKKSRLSHGYCDPCFEQIMDGKDPNEIKFKLKTNQ